MSTLVSQFETLVEARINDFLPKLIAAGYEEDAAKDIIKDLLAANAELAEAKPKKSNSSKSSKKEKDENAPKKNVTAYFLFSNDARAWKKSEGKKTGKLTKETIAKLSKFNEKDAKKQFGEDKKNLFQAYFTLMWKNKETQKSLLSAEQLKVYETLAKEDKQRYEKEMKKYKKEKESASEEESSEVEEKEESEEEETEEKEEKESEEEETEETEEEVEEQKPAKKTQQKPSGKGLGKGGAKRHGKKN
jgi:hypothetical protein